MPSPKAHRPEVDSTTAIISELHVYGTEVPVGRKDHGAWQHAGFGQELLSEAEMIRKRARRRCMIFISSLGTKNTTSAPDTITSALTWVSR